MKQDDFVKKTVRFLKDADSISKMVTGKRLKDVFASTMAILTPQAGEDPNDPYNILCIQRTAGDRVVRMAFRAAAFEFHPDTGIHPDVKKFQAALQAYEKIMEERKRNG